MMVSKRNLLFQGAIFRFHVKLWEGNLHGLFKSSKPLKFNIAPENKPSLKIAPENKPSEKVFGGFWKTRDI